MATPGSVSFYTLGCKLNFAESSSYARMFENAGYQVVPFEDLADIYIINSCSVTEFADKKCRHVVRRALRKNEQAKIVVVGCYAQLKPEEIASIPGVDLVLGAAEKFRMLDFINELSSASVKGMVKAGQIVDVTGFNEAFSFGDRTRTFLKVQDGCNYNCSFCTIPLARGFSRSPRISQLVQQARNIADMGCREIVLTGVNIGDFGLNAPPLPGKTQQRPETFLDLISALDELEGIDRYRISSIEPNLLSDEIIHFVAGSKSFLPHFHIPLQSGNDKQLKMMRRRYKRDLYKSRVETIKTLIPHAAIGVDVIVGFPGETDDDFLETIHFLESLDISYLHVFTYSERSNTPAAEMPDVVDTNKRRKRNEMLRTLSAKKMAAFYESQTGTIRSVLIESIDEMGIAAGYTENYIRAEFKVNDNNLAPGDIVKIRLEGSDKPDAMSAQPLMNISMATTI